MQLVNLNWLYAWIDFLSNQNVKAMQQTEQEKESHEALIEIHAYVW